MQTPAFRNDLIAWYDANARVLPWRTKPTPYRIWVSEIMLQQTRVETVRGYFKRFMKRFPSLRKLGAAKLEDVLEVWSGLGYYRRARMLHEAAKQVVERHGGRFPKTRKEVLALPGVGKYTSGAILSIALNHPEPIVDGNIERVFARLNRISVNVKTRPGAREIWRLAEAHVHKGQSEGHAPGRLNQALMELGATVCTPKSPSCGTCPVREYCAAFEHGDALSYPVLPARAKLKDKRYLFAAIRDASGRILMQRRAPDDQTSLLPNGLWELPHVEWKTGPAQLAILRKISGQEFETHGEAITRKHAIMNYRLVLTAQPCVISGRTKTGRSQRWFKIDETNRAAVASATRKLIDALKLAT